jgi:hypothetical protein
MTKQFTMLLVAALLAGCDGGTSTNSVVAADAPAIALNKVGKASGLEFTVTAAKTTAQIGPAGAGPKAEGGETFVVVDYTLKNTADKPLTYAERPAINLVDGKGQTYAADVVASATAGAIAKDPSGMVSDLNPRVSVRTKAAWKIEKAAFDRKTWKVVVASDPQLTFSLK